MVTDAEWRKEYELFIDAFIKWWPHAAVGADPNGSMELAVAEVERLKKQKDAIVTKDHAKIWNAAIEALRKRRKDKRYAENLDEACNALKKPEPTT